MENKNKNINAAVISQFLDDVSRCLIENHDEINDMGMTEGDYDIEKLLFESFSRNYNTYFNYEQLPLLRSTLSLMCSSYPLLIEAETGLSDCYGVDFKQLSLPF